MIKRAVTRGGLVRTLLASLMVSAILVSAPSPVAAGERSPASAALCKSASVGVVLEGSFGHQYRCSGNYLVNDSTYYLHAGSWSGYISRADGIWVFCDGANFRMPFSWTYSIYLSPTKRPGC